MGSTFVLQRMRNYIQDKWNKCDLTAITLFVLALCCRLVFFPHKRIHGNVSMRTD